MEKIQPASDCKNYSKPITAEPSRNAGYPGFYVGDSCRLDANGCRELRSHLDAYIKEQERIEEEKKKITSVSGVNISIQPDRNGTLIQYSRSMMGIILDDTNRAKLIKALQEVR